MLRIILDEVAAEADKHDCIAAMYIYGSIVRGDHSPTSDLDIFVEYVKDLTSSEALMASFNAWNASCQNWAASLERNLGGHRVQFHGMGKLDLEDPSWKAIVAKRDSPIAKKGRGVIVYTPPK